MKCWDEEDFWKGSDCIVDLWILPVVCVVGIILNTCCLLVFTSHRSHPLVPALIVLSICDLLQLTLSAFVLSLPALHEYTGSGEYSVLAQLAYIFTGLLSPLLLAFNCASIWTICYISVQRHRCSECRTPLRPTKSVASTIWRCIFCHIVQRTPHMIGARHLLAILRPLSSMHSPSKPLCPLVGIAVAALVFNSTVWFEFRWWIEVNNGTRFLKHEESDLHHNITYRKVRDRLLYPVIVYLVPLLLLCVLNFRILSHISAQRVAFDHKSRLAQERRSVTLLLSIVILFFICHTGGLVLRFVDYDISSKFVLAKDCVNLLFNISSMANPMLYFLFTRQFRDLRVSKRHFTPSRSGSLPLNVNRGSKKVAQNGHAATQHQRSVGQPVKDHYEESQSEKAESLPLWPSHKYDKSIYR